MVKESRELGVGRAPDGNPPPSTRNFNKESVVMLVSELIKELNKHPGDYQVVVAGQEIGEDSITFLTTGFLLKAKKPRSWCGKYTLHTEAPKEKHNAIGLY